MADRWKPCAKCGALVLRPDSTDDSDSTCDACRNSNSGSATSPAVREVVSAWMEFNNSGRFEGRKELYAALDRLAKEIEG